MVVVGVLADLWAVDDAAVAYDGVCGAFSGDVAYAVSYEGNAVKVVLLFPLLGDGVFAVGGGEGVGWMLW